MKILTFPQRSQEWMDARLGVVTASDAHQIVTPKTLKPSASMEGYAAELAAEVLLGRPLDDSIDRWRERGLELEAEGRDYFAFTVSDVVEVGFITSDDGRLGCSPDGISVSSDYLFGLEVKAPSAKIHVLNLVYPERFVLEHRMQVQFGLWLTKWPRWWLVSWCPGLPAVVREILPEPEVHAAFDAEVPRVLAARDHALARVRALQVVSAA